MKNIKEIFGNMRKRKIWLLTGFFVLLLSLTLGCGLVNAGNKKAENQRKKSSSSVSVQVEKDGSYTSKEEVAAYLNKYKQLPDNFITKKEAKKLGWVSKKGNLSRVAPGKSIGGDKFGNYEGTLPEKKGRKYYECDIDSTGGYRGAKRIIYSNDGFVYYTEDHYNTFELLYGKE